MIRVRIPARMLLTVCPTGKVGGCNPLYARSIRVTVLRGSSSGVERDLEAVSVDGSIPSFPIGNYAYKEFVCPVYLVEEVRVMMMTCLN